MGIVPDLVSETDTSMFDEIEPKTQEEQQFPSPKTFSGDHLPFVGFTYTSDNIFRSENMKKSGEYVKNGDAFTEEITSLKKKLEEEKKVKEDLQSKYETSTTALQSTKREVEIDRGNLKQQKEAEVRKMEREAQLMKHKLNEALCKVDMEIDKKKKLESEFEKLKRLADDLRASKEKIQEQIGRTEQSRHEELIQRCKQSDDQVQQLRKNISENKKIIASKEQSLNDILEQKNKLDDELKNSRRNKIRVENALEQEKNKYKNQEKIFQDKSDSLKCEVARLKNETNKLFEENKNGKEKYSTLERDLTKLEFELKSCKQRLDKKTSEHDTTLKSLQDIN